MNKPKIVKDGYKYLHTGDTVPPQKDLWNAPIRLSLDPKESFLLEAKKRAQTRVAAFKDSSPSRTKQAHKSECDINNIVKKYGEYGPPLVEPLQFGDVSDVLSFREAQDKINSINEHFMTLPSQIRSRFLNDPVTFMDFMNDPTQQDEKIRLGLVNPPAKEPVSSPESSTSSESEPVSKAEKKSAASG